MMRSVEMPLWLLILILLFAAVTFASHFLFPSVRWFFRRRLERAVARVNKRLERPIQPFKLARRHDMIQRLIYDPQVSQAIADHAHAKGIPENVAFEDARRYAREIVPSFSATAYFGFAIRAARVLSNALYHVRLIHHDEAALKAIAPDATVIFVMNHRSNMDYVLVTYLAAERSALSYAVGEWAQVWPLSRLIRAMGAYFIRRRTPNRLYSKVLARYVKLATDAGVTQAMFPEGRLSVSGALMPPKLGLLRFIIDDFDPDGRDVVFVPVALNYDRVLEDRILVTSSQQGGRFRARIGVIVGKSLKLFGLRLLGRKHRFGYAAVSFGAPLSLQGLRAETKGDLTIPLARTLNRRIGELVPVLPVPLTARLFLTHGAMTRQDLACALSALLERMPQANIQFPDNGDSESAIDVALAHLTGRGFLSVEGDLFNPVPDQMDLLQFYANSIRHLFPVPSLSDAVPAYEIAAPAGS